MNYFEHHIGDYDADTAHLTWVEDMAYTRLLRLYYRREKPIPADLTDACRLVRAQSKDQKQAVSDVLREFFVLAEDGWHQGRADVELARYLKKVEHNRAVGKLGGRPRKAETQTKPGGFPVGSETEPKHNPPQTPDPTTTSSPSSKKEKRASAPPCPDDVDSQVWSDWLQLRKAKRAPVTATTVQGAEAEAGKAGMSLEAFLRVWCARGSQGLEAEWLKPHERGSTGPPAEPEWRREQRERTAAFAGRAAAKPPSAKPVSEVIDATARLLD